MNKYFDFEKPIEVIDNKIKILKSNNEDNNLDLIKKYNLEKKNLINKIYNSLTSWQKVKISRHSDRPHMLDYVNNIFSNFILLSGDKKFAEDKAIVGGLAKIDDLSVMIIGNEKGNSMEKRIEHNFGMAKPEGFRKTQRLLILAEKLKLPVVTFVDTAGAFPGKEAEERGQSESIASSISQCLKVKTPIISIIIGEGGSGGAIALATADRILMLQNSIFSVISPEGCASILWRNTEAVQKAAESLKLTAEDCLELNIIDGIVKEMPGGAHRYPKEQFVTVKKTIIENLEELIKLPVEKIVADRNEKFLNITLN
jgi:acetyl-CoA carboxylase carboxyl transferase subunit alpha